MICFTEHPLLSLAQTAPWLRKGGVNMTQPMAQLLERTGEEGRREMRSQAQAANIRAEVAMNLTKPITPAKSDHQMWRRCDPFLSF